MANPNPNPNPNPNQDRIMVIDGAMGTTVQQYKFTEEDFRGASLTVGLGYGLGFGLGCLTLG